MDCLKISVDQKKKCFERDVYCLLGLPVDNMTIESTRQYLCSRTEDDLPAVWSTINVNWVVQSFRDEDFRKAIINSDLVTLDGRPLLWLSKLLGYPMSEVVPGSTMIQNLHEDTEAKKKLSIFFFGGEAHVGSLAMEKVNSQPSGLHAVGALNPGFGTVENMSSDTIIEEINRVKPDILLVALGAKKGTAWIEYNRDRLNAKVISHLGATVNFLAGTVHRAPKLFQITATEWLWRILQEPKLFFRYALDGYYILYLIFSRFFHFLQFFLIKKKYQGKKMVNEIEQHEKGKSVRYIFGESVVAGERVDGSHIFCENISRYTNVVFDFRKTEYMDGAVVGRLLLLENYLSRKKRKIVKEGVNETLSRLFHFFCIFEKAN